MSYKQEGTALFNPTTNVVHGVVQPEFRTAQRCEGGACVEVSLGDTILVRNSTAPENTVAFTREEWRVFTEAVRIGEFEVD
jgi:Domain of unknown function (DUF397)